ncbi:MAG: tetratricopeptide repeat protein, partial [Bacteroidota bacterium]
MTDSLQNLLLVHAAQDTTRVNILNDLAAAWHRNDLAKALSYTTEAEQIATNLGFEKGQAKSNLVKGKAQAFHSGYQEGMEAYREALAKYDAIGLVKGRAEVYKEMGIYFHRRGEQPAAIAEYKKSLKDYESANAREEAFDVLNRIGWSNIRAGDYEEALKYYEKAIENSEGIRNKTTLAYCFSDVGIIYTYLGNYYLALDYFKQSLAVGEKNNDGEAIANTLGNMG